MTASYVRRAARVARRVQLSALAVLARRRARSILERLPNPSQTRPHPSEPWLVTRTRSGMYIAAVGSGTRVDAYLKMGRGKTAERKLAREASAIASLGEEPTAAAVSGFAPSVLADGSAHGWGFLLLSALPGTPGDRLLGDEAVRATLLREAARFSTAFHARGWASKSASPDDLDEWVRRPLSVAEELLPTRERHARAQRLSSLEDELRGALDGKTLGLGPIHGDYWPSNILVDPVGHVIGVIDWDSFERRSLLLQDILHLLIYTRKLVRRSELGTEVVAALDRPAWTSEETTALSAAAARDGLGSIDVLRPRLLLYWLRQVALNAERQPRQTRRRDWVRTNVVEVLACL